MSMQVGGVGDVLELVDLWIRRMKPSLTHGEYWEGSASDWLTELNAGLTFSLRGVGDDVGEYENIRYKADGGFLYFRGELAHTQDLPKDFKMYGRVQAPGKDDGFNAVHARHLQVREHHVRPFARG